MNIYVKSVNAESVAAMKMLESVVCTNCAPQASSSSDVVAQWTSLPLRVGFLFFGNQSLRSTLALLIRVKLLSFGSYHAPLSAPKIEFLSYTSLLNVTSVTTCIFIDDFSLSRSVTIRSRATQE